MLRLIDPTSGPPLRRPRHLSTNASRNKALRRDMQIIFQDPYGSLDPRLPIGQSVMEGLNIHSVGSRKERLDIVMETLKKVGLETYHAHRFPHEFSGGQRQRIGSRAPRPRPPARLTSPSAPWMSPFNRRFSTSCATSRRNSASPTCSSRTT
jgi:peptide/nickel transport system ATP-binding protein/oligopeptide transport system ATP-binding protein